MLSYPEAGATAKRSCEEETKRHIVERQYVERVKLSQRWIAVCVGHTQK